MVEFGIIAVVLLIPVAVMALGAIIPAIQSAYNKVREEEALTEVERRILNIMDPECRAELEGKRV